MRGDCRNLSYWRFLLALLRTKFHFGFLHVLNVFLPPLHRFTASPLHRFTASPLHRFTASPLHRFTASTLQSFTALTIQP
jgi:hypothetical protein